ncbi:MAG: alcohol dehydrogenase catalytic domain-containing protein [Vulcanimicrobiota bacterium]
MKALMKDGAEVRLREVDPPVLKHPGQVRIRVAAAGLCRTDLYVAEGALSSASRLVLGHEFAGSLSELGSEVRGLELHQRVAVFPWLGCGQCRWCQAGHSTACPQRKMLGVHLDGAFAEEIVVPANLVYVLPETISFRAAAYAEPVAASLAILKAGVNPHSRGLVYGRNRIAELTYRLMRLHGFSRVELLSDQKEECSFDYVVETVTQPEEVARMLRLLRPGGTLVVKSRHPRPLQLDLQQLVPKEIKLSAVNYGDFQESLNLLRDPRFHYEDLLGVGHPLEDWRELFEEARRDESTKSFFRLSDVWDR